MDQITSLLTRYPWASSLFDRGMRVLVIIAVVFVCAKLIHIVCKRILVSAHKMTEALDHSQAHYAREREKRLATVIKLIDTSLRVMLFGAAFLMILREFGLDITPLLTGAGVAGVAVGFGAQSLVKDMIAGFFILIENQIRVGDVIKVNSGLSGSVERMELRVTAIRDGDGTLHIIPNGEIKSVSNMTYDFATAVVEIPIPYQTDLKQLREVLEQVAHDLEQDPKWKPELRNRPAFIGVTKFLADHMVVEIDVKTEPHSRWSVALELRMRAKLALDSAKIGMPRGLTLQIENP